MFKISHKISKHKSNYVAPVQWLHFKMMAKPFPNEILQEIFKYEHDDIEFLHSGVLMLSQFYEINRSS